MLPLTGVKVVELSQSIAGFYGGMILADMGAEVIKVEKPESDPGRDAGPLWRAAKFVAFNRNKKSIAIDLEKPQGKEVLKKLVQDSDIVLEDLDRNVVNDLGFSYQAVAKLNPKIIYASIKDCLEGPYEDRAWTDGVILALSGFMSTTGNALPLQPLDSDHPPVFLGPPVIYTGPGLHAAMWTIGTLLTRGTTEKGDYIKVGRFETCISFLQQWPLEFNFFKFFEKHASKNYRTKDGGWVYFMVTGSDEYWGKFCKAFDVPEADSAATATRADRRGDVATEKCFSIMTEAALRFNKPEIWKKLIDGGIPGGVINDVKTVVDEDTHLKATKFFVALTPSPEVTLTSEEKTYLAPLLPLDGEDYNPEMAKTWTPPPKLGEHTEDILRSLNYADAEIASLRKSKIAWP